MNHTLPVLKFYNTKTRHLDVFDHDKKKAVKLYTCGPTVYSYAHIGNFRTYVFEDLLKRALIYFGYDVFHVMNITDVDDKTIKNALKANKSLEEYTQQYTECFLKDSKLLNLLEADKYPKATEHLDAMIDMIQTLLKRDYAYQASDNSVYFSIKKFKKYGKLSHLPMDSLKVDASTRMDDEYDKDQVSDFVLWKAYDEKRDQGIYFDSPFGKGRPGWHIECSAMATKYLGPTLDIHCGGVDNIFPHHENEIAQSECCTNQTFSRYWMHAEHLIVDGKKMSKSLGNFYTLNDLISEGYDPIAIRYQLMSTHYRQQLNFTLQGLKSSESAIKRLNDAISRIEECSYSESDTYEDLVTVAKSSFDNALANDLNISQALAALFDAVRLWNQHIDHKTLTEKQAMEIIAWLKKVNTVIGVMNFENQVNVPQEVLDAVHARTQARKNRNFTEADRLRDLIGSLGYIVEDGSDGPKIKKL